MKVILDAMGGDLAPKSTVEGALEALEEDKDLQVALVGREEDIKSALSGKTYDASRLEIVNANGVISNDDAPTLAIRHKKDSSLIKGFDMLLEGSGDAFVSAGSTGAVLAGAFTKLGRIKGVSRPALAPVLPTITDRGVILCDCGANVDCKAENILHFALMGTVYAKYMLKAENPTVGLLNNGVEEKKGNALAKEAYELLKNSKSINFKGNCEARDILSGEFDVVVCDGFDGNIALKSTEGAASLILKLLKNGVKSHGLRGLLGALLLKPVFKELKGKVDYNSKGGACFLGVNGVVVKSHGASKPSSIKASLLQAKELASQNICEKIALGISELTAKSEEA